MVSLQSIKKERLIFGAYLIVLIIMLELVLHHFHLPAWPVFLVMIFFFESHMDRTKAPHLILGGLVGIACYLLTLQFVELFASSLGVDTARLIFICMVVYAIVAFGEILPMIFNNYAFMFYLVSGLAAKLDGIPPQPLVWMSLVVLGGGLVIVSILGIARLVALTLGAASTAAEPDG